MKVFKRIATAGMLAGVLALTGAAPAGANTQTIDASLTSTLSMTTAPSSSISSWTLASTGANTTSGGTMTIESNQAYTVTVTGDKAKMTEYVTSTASYVGTSPKTLGSALAVISAATSGTGVGATATVSTSAATLATGAGLGTDSYSVTLSQPTTLADPALPAGRTYHIVLTYTLSSTL